MIPQRKSTRIEAKSKSQSPKCRLNNTNTKFSGINKTLIATQPKASLVTAVTAPHLSSAAPTVISEPQLHYPCPSLSYIQEDKQDNAYQNLAISHFQEVGSWDTPPAEYSPFIKEGHIETPEQQQISPTSPAKQEPPSYPLKPLHNSKHYSRKPSSKKRSRTTNKSSVNSGNDKSNNTANRKVDGCDKDETQHRWACPYFKMDPVRHASCLNLVIRRVRDVKQHLHRRHSKGGILSCPACLCSFPDAQQMMHHIRSRKCDKQGSSSVHFSHQKQERLRHRSSRKLSPPEQWYGVWDILFPKTPRPSSPYLDTPVKETLQMLQQRCYDRGPYIISEFLQRRRRVWDDDESMSQLLMDFLHIVPKLLDQAEHAIPLSSDESTISLWESLDAETATDIDWQATQLGSQGFIASSDFDVDSSPPDWYYTRDTPLELPNLAFEPKWSSYILSGSDGIIQAPFASLWAPNDYCVLAHEYCE